MVLMIKDLRRFEAKFTKGRIDDCWVWAASCFSCGYGQFNYRDSTLAHRFSYQAYVGPIPNGMLVLHKCDNKPCVNPAHLFLGDNKANTQDMISKGRQGPASPGPGEKACKGEAHGLSKLTEHQAREIIRRYRRRSYHQSNARQLAREFGVSPNQITRIAKGVKWKHLKENDHARS